MIQSKRENLYLNLYFILILILQLVPLSKNSFASVGIEGGPIFSLLPLHDHRNLDPVFLATGTGIYQRICCLDIWRPSNDGLPSLCVYDIACFSGTLPNALYAGTRQGVAKSTDNGTTWVSSGLTDYQINTIVINPVTPTYLAAGTPEGVFISTDGGGSWYKEKSCSIAVYALAIDPKNPQTIYAGSFGDDIYKSLNFGKTWQTTCCGPKNVTQLVINPQNTNIVYAATDKGIYKSTDAGSNWFILNSEFSSSPVYGLAIDQQHPAILYAATDQGIYKTTDYGTHWETINNGINSKSNEGPFAREIVIHPSNSSLLYAGIYSGTGDDVDIYESDDGGATWKQINRKLANSSVYSIAFDPQDTSVIYAGTSKLAVMKSTDGGFGWKESNEGFTNYLVHTVATHPENPLKIFAGTANGLFFSSDGGINWSAACCTNTDFYCIGINPFNVNEIYCGTDNGLFFSSDDGEIWTSLSTNLGNPSVKAIVFSPSNEGELYVGTSGSGIFKSVSHGSAWQPINNGLNNKNILSLAISSQPPYRIFAGTQGGGIYFSSDRGATWQPLSSYLDGFTINSISINHFDSDRLYIGTKGKGFYLSTNGGLTWTVGDETLKEKDVYTVTLSRHYPQLLFVGLYGDIKIYDYNTPPITPNNPIPENQITNQPLNIVLEWSGGDPDPGDIVTYKVFFGTSPFFNDNSTSIVTTPAYTPDVLAINTTYYWKVVAVDRIGAQAESDVWSFTTIVSNQPDKPSNPSPANGAKDQPYFLTMTWNGSDPDDNDTLTYDVYFGVTKYPPLISKNQSETKFTPLGPLLPMTTYYWRIVARDNHGFTTRGDLWSFTTRPPLSECLAERVVGDDRNALELLRRFRDEVLQSTEEGRQLIRLYYALSPSLVAVLDRHPERISELRAEFQRCKHELEEILCGTRPDYRKLARKAHRLLNAYFPEYYSKQQL